MKKLLFSIILILFATNIFADFVPIEEAYLVAHNHISAKRDFARAELEIHPWDEDFQLEILSIEPLNTQNGQHIGYIAMLLPNGYIAMSADRNIRPVIAYSFTDVFRWDDTPHNLMPTILRHDLELRKAAITQTDIKILDENRTLWSLYTSGDEDFLRGLATAESYGPWVESQWNQGSPYNTYCPMDPGSGERSVVGCVATAMGMIVDYWKWPPRVTFNSSDSYYSEATTPRIWIDAPAATIDTIDYYGAGFAPTNDMKAKISYACAVACEMQFSSDGSASDTRNVPDALLEKFDYDSARGVSVMNSQFYNILKNDIKIAKPVELGIWGTGVGGHAIIADGWISSGEYHLNMGWGGYENGWYFLPSGMPSGFNMVGHQACNIKPKVITRRPPYGLSGRPKTTGSIELSWEEPLYITEPVMRYNIYRKTIYSEYSFIGTSTSQEFIDSDVEELTYYGYAISAVYDAGESSSAKLSIYSGIYGGWARNWGGTGEQVAFDVAPTGDLGCIAVGHSRFSDSHKSDIYIIRTVPGGSALWSRLISIGDDDFAYAVIIDSESNYVIAGESQNPASGDFDVLLMKIDDAGDTLWTATYGTSSHDAGHSLAQTPDGGYIIGGYTGNIGEEKAYFVKTDIDGNLQWTRSFSNNTILKGVTSVSSGGYAAVGYTNDGPIGRQDFYLIRLDSAGDSLWARNYGGNFNDVGNSIIESPTGDFLFAGNSYSYGIPIFSGIHLRKVNTSGDSVWAANYTALSHYSANSVAPLQGGGYLIAGSSEVYSDIDFLILALDESGDSLWARRYGTLGTDIAYSAIQLPDTGVVAAGVTYMDGSNDFWIMKFGGDVITRISDNNRQKPDEHTISSYPNPFNSAVSINTTPYAEIVIYDIQGRTIASISANAYGKALWEPRSDVGSGLYFIKSSIDGHTKVAKTAYIR
jgi:hypothetical protein